MTEESSGTSTGTRDAAYLRKLLEELSGSTRARETHDGDRIGRYDVEGEIARGGMGVILEAHDREVRRRVAMKVLQEREGESDELESQRASRFLEEAQVTGQLEHPGIVPVHELGLDGQGRLFFTMRLVKGRTLSDVIDFVREEHEGWTRARALSVVLKACEAMAYAHDKGVIHRDLKPANIMVGRFGETYVMDWGLAKVTTADAAPPRDEKTPEPASMSVLRTARMDQLEESATATLEGDVMGTPSYMPPEQARGELHKLGPASDVYAIGAMLYHLLSGRAPFTRDGEREPVHETLRRVRDESPEPLHTVASDVPFELAAICEKAMAREPEERYASMLALAEDLRAYLEGRVVHAYETGAVAEFKKWVSRNRGLALSLAAVLVLIVAGLAGITYLQSLRSDDLAAQNRALADAQRETEDALELAEASAESARAQEREARWQSYLANVAAASAYLDRGSAGEGNARLAGAAEELRGWEWRYLANRVGVGRTLITPFDVGPVAVGPEGSFLAAGGFGPPPASVHDVVILDPATGEELARMKGHTQDINALAISPAGTEVASTSDDGTTRLWDVETGGELLSTSVVHGSLRGTLDYHPDGRWIAIGSVRGRVGLWDTYEDAVTVPDFALPPGVGIASLEVSPDGRRIALGCTDFRARLYDLDSRELVHEVDVLVGRPAPGPSSVFDVPSVSSLAFSADGTQLLLSAGPTALGIADIEQETWRAFDLRGVPVRSARFHPSESWVVTADGVAGIRFWDVGTGSQLEVLAGHYGGASSLAVSPLGDWLATGALDGTVQVWTGTPGANVRILRRPGVGAPGLAWSPDGTHVAQVRTDSADYGSEGRVWISDARTGEETLALAHATYYGVDFRADGALITVDGSGMLRTWDAVTGEPRTDARVSTEIGYALRPLSPALLGAEGRRLAFAPETMQRRVEVWDTTSPETPRKLCEVAADLPAVFSPEGDLLVTTGYEGDVAVWELATGRRRFGFEVDWGAISAIDPEGRRLATPTEGPDIELRDLETGELVRTLSGHGPAGSLAFSPDASRLAVAHWDSSVSLWHTERGELVSFTGHTGFALGVAFSPDGGLLASVDSAGEGRIWDATPNAAHGDERREAGRRSRWRGRAAELVSELFGAHGLLPDVIDTLEEDESLPDDLRREAVRQARTRGESLDALVFASRRITLQPDRLPSEYLLALRRAERAARLWPGSVEPVATLTGANYRMGNFEAALEYAERTEAQYKTSVDWTPPPVLAFKALALHRLGRTEEAWRPFETARVTFPAMTPDPDWRTRIGGLLDEAREILDAAGALDGR